MGSQKLRAIWQIITSNSFITFTAGNGERVSYNSCLNSDLSEAITFTVALRRADKELTATIEETATENGQLQTLHKLKEAVERLN